MLLTDEQILNFKRCRRRTYLDTYGNLQEKDATKEFLLKLKKEHQAHINNVIACLGLNYHQPIASSTQWWDKAAETLALMQQGVDCIYDGKLALRAFNWRSLWEDNVEHSNSTEEIVFLASPTLLIKQPGSSIFGDWVYLPINVKLGRRPKPEYKLIATFQAQILATIQGVLPSQSQLILRQQDSYLIDLEYWLPKMRAIVADCLEMLSVEAEPEVFISRQRCNLCHWYSHCYNQAKSQQHLSLIPGVTPKRYEYLISIGIETVESLADLTHRNLEENIGTDIAIQLKKQALAILQQQPILKSELNSVIKKTITHAGIELYFDIEAEPDLNLDYLLGVLVVDKQNKSEKFYPFLAENPESERIIWQQFLDLVNLYPYAPIYHYSEYEVDTIKRLGKLYGTQKKHILSIISRSVDLHSLITKSVFLPVENYSLKTLANWIGFQWRDPGASGDQCVCWYDGWLTTKNRSLLEAILRYNEDDCRATRYLKDWLVEFTLQSPITKN
ncbi:TM0106 family RecB-like putative nuclease [Stanieria cyanosphaera]